MFETAFFISLSVFFVTYVLCLCGIEYEIANRSHQTVDTQGYVSKNEVAACSRGIALGLKRGVVDDKATYPTQEKGQQEAYEFVVIHSLSLLS